VKLIVTQIMAAGAVDEALAFAGKWARAADPSLVRYWLFATLAIVSPPYSSPFASLLLRCCPEHPGLHGHRFCFTFPPELELAHRILPCALNS